MSNTTGPSFKFLEFIDTYWPLIVTAVTAYAIKRFVINLLIYVRMRISKIPVSNPGAAVFYKDEWYKVKEVDWGAVYLIKWNRHEDGKIDEERPNITIRIPIDKYWNSVIVYKY